jgi:hypothetical protein
VKAIVCSCEGRPESRSREILKGEASGTEARNQACVKSPINMDPVPATLKMSHCRNHYLGTRRIPRVVPHPSTSKFNVAGRLGGPGRRPGEPMSGPPEPPRPPNIKKSAMSLLVWPEQDQD